MLGIPNYKTGLQWNKANVSDTEVQLLDVELSISIEFILSKIYDKRDDFDFDIVNLPFLDDDVPHSTSYRVYVSQIIWFARVFSHVTDFNAHHKILTTWLLQQGYRCHKLQNYELVSRFKVGLKVFAIGPFRTRIYGDLLCKFKQKCK